MKKRPSGGGASWMDTYGDMVTLLLCFFVLLYSMSTIDQAKWAKLVQSFNPNAILGSEEVNMGSGGPNAEEIIGAENTDNGGGATQKTIDEQIADIAEALKNYVAQSDNGENVNSENISITQGSGYVFVSFNEAVFFDGNSFILRQDGKAVLDEVAAILAKSAASIDEIRILGHTAQAEPDRLNDPDADRFLASNRATVVLVYLQEMGFIDPARMVSVGYGQWRPVADNDTQAGRIQNRRVEMIITGMDLEDEQGDSIAQYYTQSGETPPSPEPAPSA